jgi:hypothetical protein
MEWLLNVKECGWDPTSHLLQSRSMSCNAVAATCMLLPQAGAAHMQDTHCITCKQRSHRMCHHNNKQWRIQFGCMRQPCTVRVLECVQ